MNLDKLRGFEHFCFDTKRTAPVFIDGVATLGIRSGGAGAPDVKRTELKIVFQDGTSQTGFVTLRDPEIRKSIASVCVNGQKLVPEKL